MTKAKTTSRPSAEAAEPKTDSSSAEAKAKRQRGKAVPADEGSATVTAAIAPTERPNATPTTDAIPAVTPKPPRQTKAALLRARLAEPGGVSLSALIEATGWQAHTLRAAMSGLRKGGLALTRRREGEDTIYAVDPVKTAPGNSACEEAEKESASKTPRAAPPEDRDAGAADAAAASLATETNA